jgi:perosamine synthetase
MKFIPWNQPSLSKNDRTLMNIAFDSSWISGGPFVTKFQKLLKKITKRKYAYATSSGTTAIHLAYLSINLKPNDEIIVPSFGYMACANIAKLMQLKVRFCDVNIESFCISLDDLKRKITNKTRAIVIINTYGNLFEINKIKNFLKKKKIFLIEDAAESLGSVSNNKPSCSFGDISITSFHATKNITTGEGGMIFTDNKMIAKKIRLYRSHGVNLERYYHILNGHNFRLSNILSAIGFSQTLRFKKIILERKNIYNKYLEHLNLKLIKLQKLDKNTVPWTLAIIPKNYKKYNSLKMFKYLIKKKIETRTGFYSSNRLKIFYDKKNNFPNSDFLSKNVLCLPFFCGLKENQIRFICKNINNFLEKN